MAAAAPKFSVLDKHSDADCTFVFRDEDHTLGNALRFVLMRDSQVSFCGYNVPHPNEPLMHLRVQTSGADALDVLKQGLRTLMQLCDHLDSAVDAAVEEHEGS